MPKQDPQALAIKTIVRGWNEKTHEERMGAIERGAFVAAKHLAAYPDADDQAHKSWLKPAVGGEEILVEAEKLATSRWTGHGNITVEVL